MPVHHVLGGDVVVLESYPNGIATYHFDRIRNHYFVLTQNELTLVHHLCSCIIGVLKEPKWFISLDYLAKRKQMIYQVGLEAKVHLLERVVVNSQNV